MIPSLLALPIENVAAIDLWPKLAGWFVTGFIASLCFTLLAVIRRKVQQRRDDREEPVKSKADNTELTSSQYEPGEKARMGLQVMNGLFVLFCGYIFLTGRFVLSPIGWFVWILFNFGFIAAYVLGFVAAGNPKHDTKRKLAKWSNVSAVGLALLTLLASAAIGAKGGVIGGIVVGLPAVINVWAFWKRSLNASARASTGDLIRRPLDPAVLVVCLVLLGFCVLLVILFLNKSSQSASNAKTSSVPDLIPTTPKALPSPVAAVRSVIPQTPVSGRVSLKRDWLIRLPSGGTAVMPAGTHLELVSSDGSDIHVRFINGSLDEYVIPIWVTDFAPTASPSPISPRESS